MYHHLGKNKPPYVGRVTIMQLKVYLILIAIIGLPMVTVMAAVDSLPIGSPPEDIPTESDTPVEKESSPVSPYQNPDMTHFIYLPSALKASQCEMNEEETAVAQMAMNDPEQGRSILNCDPILAQVARERAIDMAERNYFGHTNPDGFGPNYLVSQAGYNLPTWYGSADDSNNIESIAAGYSSPESAWTAWLNSSGHRAHVLAEASFWEAQTAYGIGYYYDPTSTYHHYWVFITAPPEE